MGPSGDAMIGDRGVPAIGGRALRHVALDAILPIPRMAGRRRRGGEIAVTTQAGLAVIFFAVDEMAGAAPHFARARLEAAARRELFDVADHLQIVRRGGAHVDSERVFQRRYSGHEIAPALAAIPDAGFARQVALFADGVAAGGGSKTSRVHDVVGSGVGGVCVARAVAALAGDRARGGRGGEAVQRTLDEVR